MSEEKSLTIHFNNGTEMSMSFPPQIKNSLGALVESLRRVFEGDKLIFQTEERLIVIPWSAIKYVEASGVPTSALPLGSIKGARVSLGAEQGAPE